MESNTNSFSNETNGRKCHYQIGAPALIYREKIDEKSSFLQVPGHKYPRHDTKRVSELLQRRSRLATRWYYSVGEIPFPPAKRKRQSKDQKRRNKSDKKKESPATKDMDLDFGVPYDQVLQRNRAAVLTQLDIHHQSAIRHTLKTYATYDRPYDSVNIVKNPVRGSAREPKLEIQQRDMTRNLRLQRLGNADPAYLAPFGWDALEEKTINDDTGGRRSVDKAKTECFAPMPWQGNCLFCLACPCPNCLVDPSWCLFHPKGLLMDTLCVSNLIAPNAKENAGHLLSIPSWQEKIQKINLLTAAKRYIPNELCLDDTIVEIQQSGVWDVKHSECIFVVRTATHISVVSVLVSKPDLSLHEFAAQKNDLDDNLCWGNYVLKEKTRLDLRSLVTGTPSYRPVALACHPKYGNDFSSARFAFLSYSEHSGAQHTIHHCSLNGSDALPTLHPIASLRYISAIDFTSTHPMCLWCAASSYVRPPLVSEIHFPDQYPLGFGTALYSVDLRSNESVFQWSPSAEEMKPEGVFSINGILTDWDRNHTVWVTSKSAGKTWEVDCRMPYRAVNSWSLSSICDDETVSFSQRGPYGDPILLTKVREHSNGRGRTDPNMILHLDTAPNEFGFRLFQRPLHKPRFQTDSLECVSVPNLESLNAFPSIASSSLFAFPERSDELFTCGVASFRTPLRDFVAETVSVPEPFNKQDSSVLCAVSMTNKGDIFCHSMLESSSNVPQCWSFPGLPAGVAAIPLPDELDGKTHPVEHKRWKPTGGMNLKLFWSNQYPTPRDALLYIKPTLTPRVRIPMIRKEHHPSYKYRTAKDEEPFEIPVPPTSGIRILAPPGSALVNEDNTPLVIPKSLVEKSLSMRGTAQDVAQPKPTPKDKDDDQDEDKLPRSDLTEAVIDRVSKAWDMWDKLDDDDSSSDDDDDSNTIY